MTSLLYLRSGMSILWGNVVFGSIGGDWCPADLTQVESGNAGMSWRDLVELSRVP